MASLIKSHLYHNDTLTEEWAPILQHLAVFSMVREPVLIAIVLIRLAAVEVFKDICRQ